jgi:hypothetical protein
MFNVKYRRKCRRHNEPNWLVASKDLVALQVRNDPFLALGDTGVLANSQLGYLGKLYMSKDCVALQVRILGSTCHTGVCIERLLALQVRIAN